MIVRLPARSINLSHGDTIATLANRHYPLSTSAQADSALGCSRDPAQRAMALEPKIHLENMEAKTLQLAPFTTL